MKKKTNMADSIKALVRGVKPRKDSSAVEQTPYTRPVAGSTPAPSTQIELGPKTKKTDGRKNNGGARPNSGPKPMPAQDQRRRLKQAYREFVLEEIEYPEELRSGDAKERHEKMSRLAIVQAVIFKEALKGNMVAAKEINDRSLGKSPQPIIGDEDEAPVQVDLLGERILDKAYGDDTEEEE